MSLKDFAFDTEATATFLELDDTLYRRDPNALPTGRRERRRLLSPGFSFHARPGNHHRRFLATAGARPVARCVAFVNAELHDRDGSSVGGIGFFESASDATAAADVLGAALRWLRVEHGIERVWAPLDFDIWHGYRLMTRGFERPRFLGEPYNKPYYAELLEGCGFHARRRYNTLELEAAALAPLARGDWHSAQEQGYRFEPLGSRPWSANVAALHATLTRSFSGFLGFTPIALDEFARLLPLGRWAVHRRCSIFVRDREDRIVGFALVLRDLASVVRALDASRWRAGLLRLAARRERRLLLHVGGITPEEAVRHSGVATAAFAYVMEGVRRQGCDALLTTLIARGNPVRRLYGASAADARREYALYEWRAA